MFRDLFFVGASCVVYFKKQYYDYVGSNFHFVCFKLNGKSYFLLFLLFKNCMKI
jgi:hypothetical protein